MKNYVGRKCKGFRFEDGIDGVRWGSDMFDIIGQVGEVVAQGENHVNIEFNNFESWLYPISLIEEHLIPEEEDNSHGFCEVHSEHCDMFCFDKNECALRNKVVVEEPNPANHPQHYGGGDNVYEAIKVIEAWDLGFNLGNTVKYIARCGKKDDELQELKKASWYLEREIAKLENAKSSK